MPPRWHVVLISVLEQLSKSVSLPLASTNISTRSPVVGSHFMVADAHKCPFICLYSAQHTPVKVTCSFHCRASFARTRPLSSTFPRFKHVKEFTVAPMGHSGVFHDWIKCSYITDIFRNQDCSLKFGFSSAKTKTKSKNISSVTTWRGTRASI